MEPTLHPTRPSLLSSDLVAYTSPFGFAYVREALYGPAVCVSWLAPSKPAGAERALRAIEHATAAAFRSKLGETPFSYGRPYLSANLESRMFEASSKIVVSLAASSTGPYLAS